MEEFLEFISIVAAIVLTLLEISMFGLVVYAAYHFITKYW
jgi:hypothetical protein